MNKYLKSVSTTVLFLINYSWAMDTKFFTNNSNTKLALQYANKTIVQQRRLFYDPELTENKIKLIFPDSQKLIIDQKSAEDFDFFRNALNFDNENLNKRIISLPKNAPACVNKKNLEHILTKDANSITKENIIEAYNAADFLGAKEKIFYTIAEGYISKFDKSDYGPEYEILQKHLGIEHFYACGKKLQPYDDERGLVTGGCTLSCDTNIHSLHDIDYLKTLPEFNEERRRKIIALRLPSHNINQFNLKKIIKLFPNLSLLDLSDNQLHRLLIDDLCNLPDGFYLSLKNNPISSIEQKTVRKFPQHCTIHLSENNDQKINKQLEQINRSLNPEHQYLKYALQLICIEAACVATMKMTHYLAVNNYISTQEARNIAGKAYMCTAYAGMGSCLFALYFGTKHLLAKNTNKVIYY